MKRITLLICISLFLALAACSPPAASPSPTDMPTDTPPPEPAQSPTVAPQEQSPTPPAAPTLKPADSDTPVAGICGLADGELGVIRLNDPPPNDPRCLQVTAGQRLKIINPTQKSVRVALAGFDVELPPGGETIFDRPVGEYLAPGVHFMLNGSEVWLVEAGGEPAATALPPTHNQYFNVELGYSVTYPVEWQLDDNGLAGLSKEIILLPANAEPFVLYVSILIDPRSLADIQKLYAEMTPEAQKSEITFAGQPAILYAYPAGRQEIYLPYREKVFMITTDRPQDEEVQGVLQSFRFEN